MPPQNDPFVPYRPTSTRRRLLIVALAVAMAMVVMWVMLTPHLRYLDAARSRTAASPVDCAASQQAGCVGGTMRVIPAPRASAAR